MAAERGLVLGEVFAPCEVLTVPARLELAALLSVPGRTPGVLPADLAALPVHRGVRLEVRDAIVRGLGPDSVELLSGWRLREILPAMGAAGGAFRLPGTPARLRGVIERNGATTWARIGELTLAEIAGWTGVGPRTAVDLIGVVAGGLLDRSEAPPSRAAEAMDDFATLCGYEGDRALGAALERLTAAHHPAEVRAAAGRLLSGLGGGSHTCLDRLDDLLAAAGDERARAVFEHRMVRPGPRATQAELGAALGIGTERVRQLCRRAVDAVTGAFDQSPGELADLVAATAEELGAAVPLEAVAELLARRYLPPMPDSRSLLLLWLAGPYSAVEGHAGWLATDPAALSTETTLVLLEDGGVRPVDHVIKELERLGLNHDHTEGWLAEQPVRLVEGLVVSTGGSVAQVAERALSATGRAMTVPELATYTSVEGAAGESAGLRALLHRDRRFVWVGDDQFELAEWGGGDEATTDAAVEPRAASDRPADGRLWLRVDIDDGVLSGSGGPVPLPFVEALGLGAGDRRSYPTRYGPVALCNVGAGPRRGSVRPVALAVGATVGDALVLGFHPSQDDVVVTRVPVQASTGSCGG